MLHAREYTSYAKIRKSLRVSGCGYSFLALILVLILGGMMLLALFVLSMRRLNVPMPLVGLCSLAISTACHPTNLEEGAASLPLMYGVVADGETDEKGRSHVSFSSLDVHPLGDGITYA
jgi:hypothetical protein